MYRVAALFLASLWLLSPLFRCPPLPGDLSSSWTPLAELFNA